MQGLPMRDSKGETATAAYSQYKVYDGEHGGIYYLPINSFKDELPELGKLLDYIHENEGEVVAVIPNIGLTSASILLGPSFQGVKGFAVVYKKSRSSEA